MQQFLFFDVAIFEISNKLFEPLFARSIIMSSKSNFIQKVIVDLSCEFSTQQLQMIRHSMMKALDDYDLFETKQQYELITIDAYNEELLMRFKVKKTISGIAEGSIEQYMSQAKRCLTALNKRAVDVTAEDLELYLITYKTKRKVTNTTIYNMVNWLSVFFGFLEEEELIRKNPVKKLPRIKADTIAEPIFSKREEEKLYLSCDNLRDRAMLEFFIATGCRVSEVCNLKLEDIDVSTKAIRIVGKGNKLRTVYANEKALTHLERYLSERDYESEYVFTGLRKPYAKMSPSGVESQMKAIGQRAKVKSVHPHRFRATFCTRMIDKGIPLHVVQKLMGHSSVDTTMTYYRGTGNLKQEYEKYAA